MSSTLAFDTDVLTDILRGDPAVVRRAAAIPAGQQAVPVVVVEEIIRGRLNMIRRAEAGRAKITINQAYELFERTLDDFRGATVLSYTPSADALYQRWRGARLRLSTHDLRIAAICVAHSATLVSRNRRDFERAPGLAVEFWA